MLAHVNILITIMQLQCNDSHQVPTGNHRALKRLNHGLNRLDHYYSDPSIPSIDGIWEANSE